MISTFFVEKLQVQNFPRKFNRSTHFAYRLMFQKERQERRLLAYFGSFDFTRAVPLNFSLKLGQKRSEKIF